MTLRKWARYTRNEIREIIIKTLKEFPEGLTITEISKEMEISRIIISQELNNLENKIKIRRIANAKLIKLK